MSLYNIILGPHGMTYNKLYSHSDNYKFGDGMLEEVNYNLNMSKCYTLQKLFQKHQVSKNPSVCMASDLKENNHLRWPFKKTYVKVYTDSI